MQRVKINYINSCVCYLAYETSIYFKNSLVDPVCHGAASCVIHIFFESSYEGLNMLLLLLLLAKQGQTNLIFVNSFYKPYMIIINQ